MNSVKVRIIGSALIMLFPLIIQAQERNDVIKAYNEGAKAVQTDVPAAIKSFENVISLSEKVGESANDLKQKAEKVLPGLYVKDALAALNEKKPASEVISKAKKASEASVRYASPANKENADKILVQGYSALTIEYFNQKDYDKALLTSDSLLAINPEFTQALNNKALIFKAQGKSDDFEKSVDLYISKVKGVNDTAKAKQASAMALEYFRSAGSKASQGNNLNEAVTLLNKAAKYGDDKDLFYFLSDVYNKQKNFDKGLEYAQKGLSMETGNAEVKAKYYYQIATSQVGKGQTAEACTSFKNSMYGAFAEASKAQRTNLKCQ